MTEVWEIAVTDTSRIRDAARAASEAARAVGLDASRTAAAVLTASELATNMCRYAGGGRFLAETAREPWGASRALQLVALDHGPGIENVPRALADGFTGHPDSLGAGLGACLRAADFFEVQSSPGRGTVAVARFALPADRERFAGPAVTGGLHVPLDGAALSGDALAFRNDRGRRTVMLADGLGHGAAAAQASELAARFVLGRGGDPPETLLRDMHEALRRSRGAAVAVADIDESHRRLTFCGVGNVGARLYHGGRWRTLTSKPGIVGAFAPRTPFPQRHGWEPGDMLVLHTDGLPSRWTPDGVERLAAHDAAVVAAVVFRDAGSAARPLRDDTGVAVATHTVRPDGGDR
ncbi:SpoIIE family protein phosphatase [Nocardiopsis sp. N85]|uniref:SpoIIE family protein phosphatase n=1 Tax=Nocardiopsis sp. N85 TaxID=3029400 RepID=UPI00237EE9BC|nr:SpoIIE family protein phosphatase [Nocardiopsis sp. N85]MDE3721129.1 SpoIIE family protein phosphatase [Nocardiopsis sp. N85]